MIVSQTEFKSALLDPTAERPQGLKDGIGRPAGRRFDVYRNNVAVSFTEALETAFPVLVKLVGQQNFRTLASVFLRKHPPSSPLMMYYGAEMPEFLENFEPTSAIGYLPDVARLELALRESYHSGDSQAVDPRKFQEIPPEKLMASVIGLAPSVRLVRSKWPVHAIWRYNTEAGACKPIMAAEDVAVLRNEFDPIPHLLPHGGGAFLEALLRLKTLGEAFDAATSATDDFDLSAMLAILLGAGAVTSIGD